MSPSPRSADRARFDALLADVVGALPPRVAAMLDRVAVIVEDRADRATLESVGMHPDEALDLCGLHTGVPDIDSPDFSDAPVLPSQIHLFRDAIVDLAGGWEPAPDGVGGPDAVREQIRVTLLHELGHQFGLDEDDLDALGYA